MRSWNLLIQVFALANLVIGTGGFMLTGFLEPLASSLQVSVAAAGQAITVYALACALIAPLLILATGRWSRKNAILLGLALFTLGGALSALASSLPVLLAGRALMGAGSMFSALAAAVVVALSPPSQRGRALSLVMLGVGLSYAIGVPLGAWMGWVYGWQVPVWAVTAACAVMGLFLLAALPAQLPAPGVSFTGLAAAARQAPVLRIGARTLLNFIAIFCVFSYVGPVLQALNSLSAAELSLLLVSFGLAGVLGTVIGGRAADRFGPLPTLRVQLLVLAAMMALVPLTKGSVALCALVFAAWGIAGFGAMVPQQLLLATHAPHHTPLLLSLNGSMLYIGTALGAVIGGALSGSLGFDRLAWAGLPFALASLATLWFESDPSAHAVGAAAT